MVNYSQLIGEAMVLMQKPPMIDSPSGGAPTNGISRIHKVAAVEIGFVVLLDVFGVRRYI